MAPAAGGRKGLAVRGLCRVGIGEVVIGSLGPAWLAARSEVMGLSWWYWVVGAGVGLSEHSVAQRVWSLLYTALIFSLSLRPEAELRGGQFGAVALRGVGSSPVHPQLRRPVAEGSHTACPGGPSSLGKKVWVDQRPPYRVILKAGHPPRMVGAQCPPCPEDRSVLTFGRFLPKPVGGRWTLRGSKNKRKEKRISGSLPGSRGWVAPGRCNRKTEQLCGQFRGGGQR